METKIIQMAALGRSLYPGMLYDCRNDTSIPGVTLWDKKALRNDIDVQDQTKTFVKITASDSLSEKSNLLDVSASLKVSLFCGLVEVGGSARYMQDSKSSTRQSRVTMHFSQTTKFEQLTMKELGNITYPQVFDQKTATHVVTAVLYGAQAFLLFDYNRSENDSKQEIEGNLHAVVKKIPTLSIEGQASVNITENEKQLADNVNVTFYGDYELDENPTTYSDALKVCNKLPSMLRKKNSKGVPVTVWLYPLTLLNDKAAKLMREISLSLVSKIENLLEELNEVGRRCNDLTKNPITLNFPDVKERLEQFMQLHGFYKIVIQKTLLKVLPKVRKGELQYTALADIIANHYKSPFTAINMNKWLDYIYAELNVLTYYTSGLKDLPLATSEGSVNSILFHADVEVVYSFTFTSLKDKDPCLVALEEFVNSEGFSDFDKKSTQDLSFQPQQPWFISSNVSANMRQNISLFTKFYEANKNEKSVKFIISAISDPSNPGCTICFYQNGTLKNPTFQPVSKPAVPGVEIVDGKVSLKLSKSPTGETVKFRIEYTTIQPTDPAKDTWQIVTTSDANSTFTLTGIKLDQQHWVRYRAMGTVGVSEASDCATFTLTKKVDFTMSKGDLSMPVIIKKMRNKLMTNIGMSRWTASTIKSEVTNIVNNPAIPYADAIPGGLKVGMALYFQGVALAAAKSFEFNLIAGTKDAGDVNMQMLFTLDTSLSFNSKKSGNWDTNIERVTGCPVTAGSAFDIFFFIKNEGYEIYINGQKLYLYKYRLPVDKVTTLTINGDIVMNVMGTVQNWSSSTFGKELASGTSRKKDSNIQTGVPYPVSNFKKNYSGKIPIPLRPGVALFFQGVVPTDSEVFSINVVSEQTKDFAIHFKVMPKMLVFNSCRNGEWGKEDIYNPFTQFVSGGAFDLFLFITTNGYEAILNGLPICVFNHRIPVEQMNLLQVFGDVFINSFAAIETGEIIMKAIVPANA